ncbi:MAG: rod shape-determining protein MreC [Acidimicrobiia bacterium]
MVVYQPDRRRRVVLVLLVLTALALISFDERGSGTINTLRSNAADVIQPVRDLSSDAFNPVTDWLDGLGRASELQDENQRLRRELAQAKTEAAAGAAARARVKELEDLFDLPQVEDADGVVADVTGQATGFDRTFSIDKGSNDGVAKDMPVVVGGALVGKVYRVTRSSAIVQRIDDRQFGVGARIVEQAAFGPDGIALGQGDSANLKFSPYAGASVTATLKKGSVAVTRGGIGEAYPQGLPIGTVVRDVTAGGTVARDAELRPIVDLDSLDVVKVLRYKPLVAP